MPTDPWQQLQLAVIAVFNSWYTPRAVAYRDIHGISHSLGTAVTVQSMVYGNMNEQSGSGVCFTRHPSTGEKLFFGEYLFNAEGEGRLCECIVNALCVMISPSHLMIIYVFFAKARTWFLVCVRL